MAAGTRESMIRSAATLLREDGVRGTSFGRVIEHSGAPRGSIAHHFPGGKSELMHEALTVAGRDVSDALTRLRARGASSTDVVRAMCDYFASGLVATDYRSGCPVAAVAMEAPENPGLRQEAGEILDEWRAVLSGILSDEGHETGTADELADLCIAVVEGALLLAKLRRSTAPLELVGRRLDVLLAEGTTR